MLRNYLLNGKLKYFFFFMGIIPAATLMAYPVDSTTAKIAAVNFYATHYRVKNISLSLAYTEKSVEGEMEYYVYNVYPDSGFVIVSADDAAHPIIGYSSEGYYNLSHLPSNFALWMHRYKKQITSIRLHQVKASIGIQGEWNAYKNNWPLKNSEKVTAVLPLVKTTWAQDGAYDASCPVSVVNGKNTNAVAGCVATAMGQIMKYWAYPPHGIGISSYTDAPYGILSAIYDTTHYNWAAMPPNVTKNNPQVATLMYDCGVSVNMIYTFDNSSSYVVSTDNPPSGISSQSAFVQHFGYNGSTIQGLYMSNYSGSEWLSLLENELNNKRPLVYAGSGDSGGHAWVCDGYDASNYFHMNWGWAGYEDGYFNLSALNPDDLPFNSGEEALIGIEPAPAVADFSANTFIIWAGDTVRYTDNSFGPVPLTDWQWSFPGAVNTSSSLQNPIAIYNTPGTYNVSETAISSEGSGTTTQHDYILVLTNNTVNVYPTLNDGTFNVQLHDASMAGSNIKFSLYNILGQKVYTTTLIQYRTQVTVTVPHGMYFFRAFDASGKPVSTGKLVMK